MKKQRESYINAYTVLCAHTLKMFSVLIFKSGKWANVCVSHVTTSGVKVQLRLYRIVFGIPHNYVLQPCYRPINTALEAVSLCDNVVLLHADGPGSHAVYFVCICERKHAHCPVAGQNRKVTGTTDKPKTQFVPSHAWEAKGHNLQHVTGLTSNSHSSAS